MRSKEQYEEKENFPKLPMIWKFKILFFQGLDLFLTDRSSYRFEWRSRKNNRRNKVLKFKPNERKKNISTHKLKWEIIKKRARSPAIGKREFYFFSNMRSKEQ